MRLQGNSLAESFLGKLTSWEPRRHKAPESCKTVNLSYQPVAEATEKAAGLEPLAPTPTAEF